MNKWIFQIVILGMLALIAFTTIRSFAQNKSFAGVTTFTTPAGRVGFFEQGTGIIYLYDNNLNECVFKGKLNNLGDPIEKIK